jgi:uncharacterized protein (DUF983 family)
MSNPWDDLEPAAAPAPAETGPGARGPGAFTVFLRGATRRCPRCGSGRLFARWFTIRDRCPRCGLRLEREEGGFLGAMTINYTVTAIVWLVMLVVWLVVDLPDLHVPALTITSIAIALLVPLLFWPFSKTVWASVDYLIYRTSPDYGSREAADRASGNGGRP